MEIEENKLMVIGDLKRKYQIAINRKFHTHCHTPQYSRKSFFCWVSDSQVDFGSHCHIITLPSTKDASCTNTTHVITCPLPFHHHSKSHVGEKPGSVDWSNESTRNIIRINKLNNRYIKENILKRKKKWDIHAWWEEKIGAPRQVGPEPSGVHSAW